MLAFIQNRPPLVVIFLCILTAGLTLTYFTFYIRSSNFILDNDVIYNWNQLLKHFERLENCIENETDKDILKVEDPLNDIVTVNTLIKVSSPHIHSFSSVQGNLILEGWHPVCDNNGPPPNQFKVMFNVPMSNSTQFETCASIIGPKKFLPQFLQQNCNVNLTLNNKPLGRLLTSKKKHTTFCTSGSVAQIMYLHADKKKFANYLNNEEKDVIYIHLLWSIYILFGVLIIILLYAFFDSNQHIKYIEKCSNLIKR